MEKELGDFTTPLHGLHSMSESCGKTCPKRLMATIDLNQGFKLRVFYLGYLKGVNFSDFVHKWSKIPNISPS